MDANNTNNRPLTLTLSFHCPICYMRVKTPVACSNGHCFCASCFDSWRQRAATGTVHCPTCRVEITAEKPILTLIGGRATETEEEIDFRKDGLAEELDSIRRLRRTRMELVLSHYERENEAWEQMNRTMARELAEARLKISELESQASTKVDVVPPSPSPVSSSVTIVEGPPSHLTTPTKATSFLKLRFRTSTDLPPPAKRPRFDADDGEQAGEKRDEDQNEVIAALEAEVERLEAENARLRQIVPTPSKWPQHELSSAKLRIKELEKDLESSRKALDVADDYSEKLSARVAELERRLRIG